MDSNQEEKEEEEEVGWSTEFIKFLSPTAIGAIIFGIGMIIGLVIGDQIGYTKGYTYVNDFMEEYIEETCMCRAPIKRQSDLGTLSPEFERFNYSGGGE